MWERALDGRTLRFRLIGINNQNFLMEDLDTGSWWQQVTGVAVSGPLAGKRLTVTSVSARVLSTAVCAFAGFMIVTGALNSQGSDLRPTRNTDLAGLVQSEAKRNAALAAAAIPAAAAAAPTMAIPLPSGSAGTTHVFQSDPPTMGGVATRAIAPPPKKRTGPGVAVTLRDAPLDVQPAGVDEELLIVHQQDIQAVVNALWSGGAEAMTIQGQRVTSRTGIKCVGNTVVVHGVPYAPPYVIVAIGGADELEAALVSSQPLKVYQQYVRAYGLGYAQERLATVTLPEFKGSTELTATREG